MLRFLGRMRFSVTQRNFFPIPPLYPEQDDLVYRPKITTIEAQMDQHEKIYRHKFHKLKDRVKARVQEISKKDLMRPEKQKIKVKDQVAKILSEVYFDQETKLPIGLFFDDFIMDMKAKKGQKQDAEYAKKITLLLDKLRYMNEGQRKQYAIELLTKSEAPQHIKEARKLIFDRILNAIQKLPKMVREQYTEEKVENMIDPKMVDVVTAQLAREKIEKDLRNYDIKVPKQPPKQYEQITKELGFYESPVTDEGVSDDERLLNMRYVRPSDGQEALQTQQSIRDKVNMDFIKRAYLNKLENQKEFLASPEDQNSQQLDERGRVITLTDQDKLVQYFDRVEEQNVGINIAAQTINKQIDEQVTFESIVDCIDHLLLDAPQFIKDMYYDKNNKNKPYESRFQDIESQVSLLWKDFDDTFPTVFPELEKIQQTEEAKEKQNKVSPIGEKMKSMISNDDVDEDEQFKYQMEKLEQEIYPIELYKELQQPQNFQFFHHYLTNIYRLNHEQINDGMQAYNYNLNPYTYEVPKTAMMYDDVDQDFDDKQSQLEEFQIDDNKNIQVNELVQKDYNEASLLTYVGRGKRKSAICYVQLKKGTGTVTINGKNVINYFPHPFYRRTALRVLELVQLSCLVDVEVLIKGGSQSTQSQCICSGLSRAIVKMCPSAKGLFRKLQLTLTDNRQVERKKVGLYKARKKYPYSRR